MWSGFRRFQPNATNVGIRAAHPQPLLYTFGVSLDALVASHGPLNVISTVGTPFPLRILAGPVLYPGRSSTLHKIYSKVL